MKEILWRAKRGYKNIEKLKRTLKPQFWGLKTTAKNKKYK